MLTTRLLKSRSDRQHSKKENSRSTGRPECGCFSGVRLAVHASDKKKKGAVKNGAAFLRSLWER